MFQFESRQAHNKPLLSHKETTDFSLQICRRLISSTKIRLIIQELIPERVYKTSLFDTSDYK